MGGNKIIDWNSVDKSMDRVARFKILPKKNKKLSPERVEHTHFDTLYSNS